MDLMKLQNGSDIRGTAIQTPGGAPALLTEEIAAQIAYAFAQWVKKEVNCVNPLICVGRDSRTSGPALVSAIISGLNSAGAEVYDFGLAATPAMYEATKHPVLNAHGAIMVTASHMPYDRNGMKFFTKQGGLNKSNIADLLNFARGRYSNIHVDNNCRKFDFMSIYANGLVEKFVKKTADLKPLSGISVIVDAGNGCGGFFVDKVLITLGADTKDSLFLEPDGLFPNHLPNPENVKIMQKFVGYVKDKNADIGIMFDTDADRAALVASRAMELSRSKLIALMADITLIEHPGSTIVTDSVTSASLSEYIKRRGGVHHRFQRGYNNVINEAKRINEEGGDCWLAIETSGHCALKENDFLDDGAYLALKALIYYVQLRKQGKTFADALSDYKDPLEEAELRPFIKKDDFKAYGQMILAAFEEYINEVPGWEIETPNYEGIRVKCNQNHGAGWALMRLSLHEPQLAVNIESSAEGGAERIASVIKAFLGRYDLEIE